MKGVLLGETVGVAVRDEKGRVVLEMKDLKDLIDGEIPLVGRLGAAGGEDFVAGVGVAFEGGLGVVDDGVMDLLLVLILPSLHLILMMEDA